jgi:hypothetical protein
MVLIRASSMRTSDTANVGIQEAGCEGNEGGGRKGECMAMWRRMLERREEDKGPKGLR